LTLIIVVKIKKRLHERTNVIAMKKEYDFSKAQKTPYTRRLRSAVKQVNTGMLEQQHKKGYVRRPVGKDEFSMWASEQEWGDKCNGAR
jgi:hypothetical protein